MLHNNYHDFDTHQDVYSEELRLASNGAAFGQVSFDLTKQLQAAITHASTAKVQ